MKKLLASLLVVAVLLSTLLTACAPEVTDPTQGSTPTDATTTVPTESGTPNVGTESTDPTTATKPDGTEATGATAPVTTEPNTPTTPTQPGSTEATVPGVTDHTHTDSNSDEICDACNQSVIVIIDFYALNDLHGKFCDTAAQPGVDELATYLRSRENYDDNVVIFSSGDMWQGAAESNLTNGLILTEWMNSVGFVSMTLGNHEYDWGEEKIRLNYEAAEFPFLAINIYDRTTGMLADYCTPSVVVERDGIQIGIIGAMGDCYSSISADRVTNVEFKVGSQLTSLIKAESERLRSQGVDVIVLSMHDGMENYDSALSNGYVDVCFEGHTHSQYVKTDSYGVYHLQGGGENKGLSHAELSYNTVSGDTKVTVAEFVGKHVYQNMEDDPATEALEEKYTEIIDYAYDLLGVVSTKLWSSTVEDIVSELYLRAGMERWGDQYDIVLGGGFLKTRSPYDLAAGQVTYSQVLSLLPFDNQIVLCKISGRNLRKRFVNTTNSDYHNTYSEYGNGIKNQIKDSETYYIVVDMYTAVYAPNGLTIVEYYDEGVYARDLLAQEIMTGRFDNSKS